MTVSTIPSTPATGGPPMWRRIVLVIAAIGFLIGIFLSYRAQPDILSSLSPAPLVFLALVLIPITVLLNALEFRNSALLLGQNLRFAESAEITIIASVANMLPIPGGTMVRIAALKAGGASLKSGTSVTLLVALLWISIAFLYAAAWLWWSAQGRENGLDFVFGAIGLGAFSVCFWLFFKTMPKTSTIFSLVGIKMALVLMDALRIFTCFLILGLEGSFGQASVLTVSSVLGAAVSIVPAGLGIREGAAALLAPFVALAATSAYLTTSLNRIVGLAIMAPVALFLGLRQKKTRLA